MQPSKALLERYEELIALGRLTSSSLDYKNIQKRAVHYIKKIIPCEKVLIYRMSEEHKDLRSQYTSGKKAHVQEICVAINEQEFVGSCARHKAIMHIHDVKNDLRYAQLAPEVKQLNPNSMLLAPMASKGEILGVIQFINLAQNELKDQDVYFLEALAHELVSALEISMLFEQNQRQFIQVVQSLADALSKKDLYTGGHTKRVQHFSEMIAAELELSFQEWQDLKLASVLHDVGKIGIEDKILKKQAPLTEDEFVIMREHPRLGHEILGHIQGMESVNDAMRFHHERYDGLGYPYGLAGDKIPVLAQIISVADTFDAMISNRPYRKGMPPMVAYAEILKHAGGQFDPKVVAAFKRAFEKTRMYKPEELDKEKKAA